MKNLQAKILLIFGVIGTLIILGMGGFFLYIINNSALDVQTQITQTKILILTAILVFCCIIILLWIYIYNSIISPVVISTKLISIST